MKAKLLLGIILTLLPCDLALAQYLWVNLSVKAVLNPDNGQRSYNFTEANLDATIARMNEWLALYKRGYRMRREGPILNVGGVNDTNGPSKWFYPNPRANYPFGPGRNIDQMEKEALAAPATYKWNSNAVNYYVVFGFWTNAPADAGECAFPSAQKQMILMGTVDSAQVFLHETGHWFELYHSQSGEQFETQSGQPCNLNDPCVNCPVKIAGDNDQMADTSPDHQCYASLNEVALGAYQLAIPFLDETRRSYVTNSFYNLMSYHIPPATNGPTILTELQLDRWTDFANFNRSNAISGRTWFVSLTGNDSQLGLLSTIPKRRVLAAVTASNPAGGDVVLLRPGNYNETITINRRVTLRVPVTDWVVGGAKSATIGRP